MKNDTAVQHSSEIFSITLNRFLHRIECKATMIDIAIQHGCHLSRIRRSKNWVLKGKQSQLTEMSKKLSQQKTLWISESIDKALPKPTFKLEEILKSNPNMTVNTLIAETGCSMIEARDAIDRAEGFSL
ncbi:ribosome recycling factor family protein [Psychromonas sp. KJ10-10]|uniref:ribosome recycling factor family protein n=1 Tax=Psychromonas sp. KJ10-10 TaxID=3391823 RepID=UPI0039B494D2